MSIFSGNYLQGCFKPDHPEKCLNYNGRILTLTDYLKGL